MVFGTRKKRRPATFKQRVTDFWEWYPRVADRFFETIEAGRCEDLAAETGRFMEETLPELSWVFGPGEKGGHSFTVTGEGCLPKQLLADYWHRRAPELPGWTFFASRQPSSPENLRNIAIGLGDNERVDAESFLLKTAVDSEAKKIDITAWHPALEKIPPDDRYTILFLLLDEALGEFGTEMWLGDIDIEPIAPHEQTQPLTALPEFIRHVGEFYAWEKLSPIESYTLYELSEQNAGRRGDTVVGTTCIPSTIFEFLDQHGILPEDPLEGTGAELVFVAVDGEVFPAGSQADVRHNIEEALAEALERDWSGRVLGGAYGTHNSYIDVLIFDGDESRALIEKTLTGLQLEGRSRIHRFAAGD